MALQPIFKHVSWLCFYTCLWFCSQGGMGDGVVSHPGRKLRVLARGGPRPTLWGGVSRPTTGGSPGPHLGGGIFSMYWGRPPPTATAAGSTHPIGMHSCYVLKHDSGFCVVSDRRNLMNIVWSNRDRAGWVFTPDFGVGQPSVHTLW